MASKRKSNSEADCQEENVMAGGGGVGGSGPEEGKK